MTIHFIVWLCTDRLCWWFDFAVWWLSCQVVVKLNMDVELLCNMEMFWWDSSTDPDYEDTCFHCPTGVHSCPEPHSTQGCCFRNQQSQNFITAKHGKFIFPEFNIFIFTANFDIYLYEYVHKCLVEFWMLGNVLYPVSTVCVCGMNWNMGVSVPIGHLC